MNGAKGANRNRNRKRKRGTRRAGKQHKRGKEGENQPDQVQVNNGGEEQVGDNRGDIDTQENEKTGLKVRLRPTGTEGEFVIIDGPVSEKGKQRQRKKGQPGKTKGAKRKRNTKKTRGQKLAGSQKRSSSK